LEILLPISHHPIFLKNFKNFEEKLSQEEKMGTCTFIFGIEK